MTTTHPVDSTITQGASIPDDALDALVAATIPDRDDSAENLSDPGATIPAMTTTTSPATHDPATLLADARRHARAAAKAMDTLRPHLNERGQFVADIAEVAAQGIEGIR
ncbi:MAG: hypothetical protein E6R06_22875 [Mycobacterium sp.]|jgi:hypothetical protein|nr:MAG: hypothetical protein E6R06_22875 [Mycobacterium sp.]